MLTICVPDLEFAAALAGSAGDYEVLVWDGRAPESPDLDRVQFLVPEYQLRSWDRADLDRLPNLAVIQLLTAGSENWAGVVAASVTLCSGRGIHGGSTAELAFAAILSHLHELPRFEAAQQEGRWDRIHTPSLRGRRVLVLGAGDIGERVAAASRVFDAEVTVIARTARAGVRSLTELPTLLPTADVVVIALPNTPQTVGLVDAEFLKALPDGALVVNVARGPIVVTEALLAELLARRLYAFLDVFEVEPLPAADPLWTAPNLVFTPHVGGGADGWQPVAHRLVRAQVERYASGLPLANVVRDGY